jgi:hypothetical protein
MKEPEFYIGYLPSAPEGLARTARRVTAALAVGVVMLAGGLVLGQAPFPAATFEYGQYREFEGAVREYPYPRLGDYLLAAPGKRGAAELVRGLDGQIAWVRGSLIHRGDVAMIEVESVRALGRMAAPETAVDLGAVRLAGEIVDGKCWLGVMNPGGGKVHRDCAARCLSGGIAPLFVARDAAGVTRPALLAALTREQAREFAGEPVWISGRLSRAGRTLILRAESVSRER